MLGNLPLVTGACASDVYLIGGAGMGVGGGAELFSECHTLSLVELFSAIGTTKLFLVLLGCAVLTTYGTELALGRAELLLVASSCLLVLRNS